MLELGGAREGAGGELIVAAGGGVSLPLLEVGSSRAGVFLFLGIMCVVVRNLNDWRKTSGGGGASFVLKGGNEARRGRSVVSK